jgi:hypothetical protein
MDIEYTIKIKDKHNPPTFDEKLGQGVVSKVVVTFKGATEENLKSPLFQRQVFEQAEEFLKDWFEVTFKQVEDEGA